MKKFWAITCLTVLLTMMTTAFSFAESSSDFKVISTYPENNQTNTTKDNMCVKLEFSNAVGNKSSQAANEDTYKIVDSKGKELPTLILYNPKNTKEVLVVVDTEQVNKKKIKVKDEEVYKLTLSKNFEDNNGNRLGKDLEVKFTTVNAARGNYIYFGMMIVMFGAIFFVSSKQMKKHREEEQDDIVKDTFNPYKEAKRTGKSVEEVMAIHQKEVEKQKKKQAKKSMHEEKEPEDNGNFRVKAPRPISVTGSTYITGRKALAEENRRQEAERKAQKAANKKAKNYSSRSRKKK